MRIPGWPMPGALALMFVFGVGPSEAGSCARHIYRAQSEFNLRLLTAAAKGKTAAQSKEATLHHQPTPKSLAHAEEDLGEFSHEKAHDFGEFMKLARAANTAGDRQACEKALADARNALK